MNDYRNHVRIEVVGGRHDAESVHRACDEVFSVSWSKGEKAAREGRPQPSLSEGPVDASTDYAARVRQLRAGTQIRPIRIDVANGKFVHGSLTAALGKVADIGLAAGYDATVRAGHFGTGGVTEHERLVYEHLQAIRGRARA